MRPGSAITYGSVRLSSPSVKPRQTVVKPLRPITSIAPMPAAGVGFAMSIGAAGKAQALRVMRVSPASVLRGDLDERIANVRSEHAKGSNTRLIEAS